MNHTLVLIRHAKSDWSGDESDRERPLAERGRRQAPEAGRWLAESGPSLDAAVVSPARRAADTWALVAAELSDRVPARVDEDVYSFSARDLLGVVRRLPEAETCVALVGHNPGLGDLIGTLTEEWPPMPTSAIAVIELDGPWRRAGSSPARLAAWGRPPS